MQGHSNGGFGPTHAYSEPRTGRNSSNSALPIHKRLNNVCNDPNRPDLAFAVSLLSRFTANPSVAHTKAIHRALQYLKNTRTLGITYDGNKPSGFCGYSDSDWAGDPTTRRSTSGYV